MLIEAVFKKQIKNALDLGCGSGTQTVPLALLAARIDLVDLNPRPQNIPHFDNIHYTQADLENYEIRNKYDLIVLRCALHFLKDPIAFLKKITQSVNVGGLIYIVTFGRGDIVYRKSLTYLSNDEIIGALAPLSLLKFEEAIAKENHQPLGEHTHEMVYMVFKGK